MAATIDMISALAHPSWREAVTRAARERVSRIPDTTLRATQVGYAALSMALPRTRETGIAAYARQREQYNLWKETSTYRPVRVTPPTIAANRPPATGAVLDLKL